MPRKFSKVWYTQDYLSDSFGSNYGRGVFGTTLFLIEPRIGILNFNVWQRMFRSYGSNRLESFVDISFLSFVQPVVAIDDVLVGVDLNQAFLTPIKSVHCIESNSFTIRAPSPARCDQRPRASIYTSASIHILSTDRLRCWCVVDLRVRSNRNEVEILGWDVPATLYPGAKKITSILWDLDVSNIDKKKVKSRLY